MVERKLPVLANKGDTAGRQILQMNIVSQDNLTQPRIIAPKIIEFSSERTLHENQIHLNSNFNIVNTIKNESYNITVSQKQNYDELNINNRATLKEPTIINDNATTPSRVASPTNMTEFIEMSVNHHHNHANNDNVLLNTRNDSEPSFAGNFF